MDVSKKVEERETNRAEERSMWYFNKLKWNRWSLISANLMNEKARDI